MKEKFNKLKEKYFHFIQTHKKTKVLIEYTICGILTFLSALFISIGFKVFMTPDIKNAETIITGGVGGLAKIVCLIFDMGGSKFDQYSIYAIFYFVLNIPVLVLAFKMGLKYGIFTVVNVLIVSLLTNYGNISFVNLFAKNIACIIEYKGYYFQAGIALRIIFAAIFGGAGTVIAYYAGSSSGGIDTVAQYLSFKKRLTVGKLFLIINSCIIFVFGILTLIHNFSQSATIGVAKGLQAILYAYLYQIFVSFVIDFINRSYRKEQLQIITKNENLSKLIIETSHHAATIVKAKGAYSNEDNYIIYIVVNLYETHNLIKEIQKADPHCFVNILSIKQIYGRFRLPKLH